MIIKKADLECANTVEELFKNLDIKTNTFVYFESSEAYDLYNTKFAGYTGFIDKHPYLSDHNLIKCAKMVRCSECNGKIYKHENYYSEISEGVNVTEHIEYACIPCAKSLGYDNDSDYDFFGHNLTKLDKSEKCNECGKFILRNRECYTKGTFKRENVLNEEIVCMKCAKDLADTYNAEYKETLLRYDKPHRCFFWYNEAKEFRYSLNVELYNK